MKKTDLMGEKVKYKNEDCERMLEYFSKKPRESYKESYYSDGALKSREPVILAPEFPTFELFAEELGTVPETFELWSAKHPRFAAAYERAKNIQLGVIKTCAVMKQFDASFSKFYLTSYCGAGEKSVQNTLEAISIAVPEEIEDECG